MSFGNGVAPARLRLSLSEWVANNLHTLLLCAVMLGGWLVNWGTLSAKTSDVERAQSKIEQRFNDEVVPRKEHEVRDRMLDDRLAHMQATLDDIQKRLADRKAK